MPKSMPAAASGPSARAPPTHTSAPVSLYTVSSAYLARLSGSRARYAELTVYSDTGADVCVGEFRVFGPDPAAARMDARRGPVLHPAGTRGRAPRSPTAAGPARRSRSCARTGANYVRMRLWVNPPPGYSNLASDLALARQVHRPG